jgi:glycosyltransferase involved in cell wall biosynthesis
MRKRFIQSHLALVDEFVVPSEHVRGRYVDWGLPPRRVTVAPYLMEPRDRLPDRPAERMRNRFAYFGQLNPYKGVDVLLEAMDVLGADFDGHLWIHGANLDKQAQSFRSRFEEVLHADRPTVTFAGPYERARLHRLLEETDWVVVPSIWPETGPLTAMEALQHGRPVICSDVGGMAEKVADGHNGLHFRRGDAAHLAEVMASAVTSSGLWDRLRSGIPARFPQWEAEQHLATMAAVYDRALAARRPAPTEPLEVLGA